MTSVFQLVDWIGAGIPREAVFRLRNRLSSSSRELFTQAFDVDPHANTLSKHTFQPFEGDTLVRVACVLVRSTEIFGSEDRAGEFMARKNMTLRDGRPILLTIQSSVGFSLVMGVLARLETGTAP